MSANAPNCFNAYLMVDWSANSTPKHGADSIWYCLLVREADRLVISALANPGTRHAAIGEIRELLIAMVEQQATTLVGFDFPYSYPTGFADALGLRGLVPWQSTWTELCQHIQDLPNNSNNRFEVAAEFNHRISGEASPFWGCSERFESSNLSRYKPLNSLLPEFRLTDRWGTNRPQSVWKLAGAGSVGGQTLLGIPCISALRNDPRLAAVSTVWPFETGLTQPIRGDEGKWLILHAEIYPSLIEVQRGPDEIKDKVQVRELAKYFARADDAGALSRMLLGPPTLMKSQRQQIVAEEGWILGVMDTGQANLAFESTAESTSRSIQRPMKPHGPPPQVRSEPPSSRGTRGETTKPGYENRNGQIVVRPTGLPGTDHCQYIYVLRCSRCGHEYGANGSDIHLRKCPKCQAGRPGLQYQP